MPAQYWELFANADRAAHYSPVTRAIHLDAVTSADWISGDEETKARNAGLLAHEATHWLDHHATVWGAEHILRFHFALAVRENNDPTQFHLAMAASRETRFAIPPSYFEVAEMDPTEARQARPWMYALTAGKRFERDGRLSSTWIPFVRFHTLDRRGIARVPMSLVALTEANAVASELVAAGTKGGADAKISATLYDPRFAKYTAAAHLIASRLRAADMATAYARAAALATLCLNLTSTRIASIEPPDMWREGNEGAAIRAALRSGDRGVAFFCLVAHSTSADRDVSPDVWLEGACRRAGLTSLVTLAAEASRAIADIRSAAQRFNDSDANGALGLGARLHALRGVWGEKTASIAMPTSGAAIPPFSLGDGSFHRIGQRIAELRFDDERSRRERIMRRYAVLEQFLDACGF